MSSWALDQLDRTQRPKKGRIRFLPSWSDCETRCGIYGFERGKVAPTAAARATTYEAVVGSISPRYQAKITHDEGHRREWLIVTFPQDEWFLDTRPGSYWSDSFGYESSYEGEKRWRKGAVMSAFEIEEIGRK
jgi:hypothetical protein